LTDETTPAANDGITSVARRPTDDSLILIKAKLGVAGSMIASR
jgi:hypothetical protein